MATFRGSDGLRGATFADVDLREARFVGSDLSGVVMRAVEILEQMGSSQARELLQTLARAAPEDKLVQEAKAALERLEKRQPAP